MKDKYFLCVLKWDAQQHKEIVVSRSKGYDSVQALMSAAAPWIADNFGRKFFVQKYSA